MASGNTPSSKPAFYPLTTRVLLKQSLPSLTYHQSYHTTSKSLHDVHFTGLLEPWDSFEADVFDFCSTIETEYDMGSILGYASSNPSGNDIMFFEHFRCGEEISVSGRFSSNALHVVSAIGKDVGLTTVFGDWKATKKEKQKTTKGKGKEDKKEPSDTEPNEDTARKEVKRNALLPDFSLLHSKSYEPRAVGEAKTPWSHDIGGWWYDHGTKDGNITSLRHALGQIAQYMQTFDLKYGYLTTYQDTLFLKQEIVDSKHILYCSAPMRGATATSPRKPSLRECLFYLQYLGQDTPEDPQPWRFNPSGPGVSGGTSDVQWFVKKDKGESGDTFKSRRNKALEGVDESLDKWRLAQEKREDESASLDSTGQQIAGKLSRLDLEGPVTRSMGGKEAIAGKEVTFHKDTKKE